MNNNEENNSNKELSTEEMRNAVMLANVMPNIAESFDFLKTNLRKQMESYTTFAKTFNGYSEAVSKLEDRVDKLIGEISTIEKLTKQIGELEAKVKDLEKRNSLLQSANSSSIIAPNPAKEEKQSKEEKKHAKEEPAKAKEPSKPEFDKKTNDDANKVIETIYSKKRAGSKTRHLPLEEIMHIGGCTEKVAREVIRILVGRNKYNEKAELLTY